MKPDPEPVSTCGTRGWIWLKKSSKPGGTCPCRRRCVSAVGLLSTEMDTTAGVTWSAISTNALLAWTSGATSDALGLLCAKPSFDRSSAPEAMINPPRKAATTATVHRARDDSEDIKPDTLVVDS